MIFISPFSLHYFSKSDEARQNTDRRPDKRFGTFLTTLSTAFFTSIEHIDNGRYQGKKMTAAAMMTHAAVIATLLSHQLICRLIWEVSPFYHITCSCTTNITSIPYLSLQSIHIGNNQCRRRLQLPQTRRQTHHALPRHTRLQWTKIRRLTRQRTAVPIHHWHRTSYSRMG